MRLTTKMQHRHFSKQFSGNVLSVFRGTALSQLILLLIAPILTRFYEPSAFGMLQTYQSIFVFFLVSSAFKYELAVPMPSDDKRAADLVLLGIGFTAVTALLLSALIVIAKTIGVDVWRGGWETLYCLPFAVLLGGSAQTLNYWAMRHKQFRLSANSKISQSVGLSFIAILGCWLNPTGLLLLLSDIFGKLISSLLLFKQSSSKLIVHWKNTSWQQLIGTARDYRTFPLISLPGALINTAGFSMMPLMLVSSYGVKVAGFYALVDRVLGAPSGLISSAIGQVYTADLAESRRNSSSSMVQQYLRIILTQAKIAAIPTIAIVFFAPDLFAMIFGNNWYDAGGYARALAILYFISFVFSPVNMTLVILERQKLQFYWDLIRLMVVAVIWLVVIPWFSLSPLKGLLVYALAMSACYFLHLALCLWAFNNTQKEA